jgi:hypothetical protein
VGWHSAVGIVTRYGLDDPNRIPAGTRFSAHFQTDSKAHPASCTVGIGSFLGVMRPRRGVDHLPLSSAGAKERVDPNFYSLSEPSWPVVR